MTEIESPEPMNFREAASYAFDQKELRKPHHKQPISSPDLIIPGCQQETPMSEQASKYIAVLVAQDLKKMGQSHDEEILEAVKRGKQEDDRFWASRWSGFLGTITGLDRGYYSRVIPPATMTIGSYLEQKRSSANIPPKSPAMEAFIDGIFARAAKKSA